MGGIYITIQKVTLCETKITQQDGEFIQNIISQKTVPCVLTNYSLKKGKELGILESSLLSDIMESLETMNILRCVEIIFLGCIGADPNFDLDLDDFILRYQNDFEESVELYQKLLIPLLSKESNKFAEGLKASTSSKKNEEQGRLK